MSLDTDSDFERLETANGCCGGPAWRGRLCEYHRGYECGVADVSPALEAEVARLRAQVRALENEAHGLSERLLRTRDAIEKLRDEIRLETRVWAAGPRPSYLKRVVAPRLTEILERET